MNKFKIKKIKAREVLDNRGYPTVEVQITTEGNVSVWADVPSGRSTGKYEAIELRDEKTEFLGFGVRKAIQNVENVIAPQLIGMDVRHQREIDRSMIELDGTKNKSKLGANAIVGVSLCVAKAAAVSLEEALYRYVGGINANILPTPFLNLINGGKLAATELDFQEHIVIPVGARNFSEAMQMGTEVYLELAKIMKRDWGKHSLNTADEGGYTPIGMKDPREAFDAELEAIEELGYQNGFILGIDAAATHFYDEKKKKYIFMGKERSREQMLDFYEDLCSTYPVKSIEDPLMEDDFEGFAELTKKLDIQIIGDDLFVTNIERLSEGIKKGSGNAILWKVNQVGTLSEALDTAESAYRNRYGVQVSERSGQTEDTWLADLVVALNAGQIKTGAPCRGERISQYNRLFRIEEELGKSARFAGKNFRLPI
ncbi:MAG: phosphopyruvate hydratase [Candidatus Methanofastidiosia archaeon]